MIEKFQALLQKEGIRHFTARELFTKGASDARLHLNTDPPEALWHNIIPTVKVLDLLRERVGGPIQILSAYRSPAYNRAIGGAPLSQHVQFRACDIRSDAATPSRLYNILLALRTEGAFSGGLGRYRTFVHIDTRGRNATWTGQ